ncbi:MAG: hypothetical protein AAGB05_04055 [Pseudomonadota bacterium]
MDTLVRLERERVKLEERLARDVAAFSDLLAPLPAERDADQVQEAWNAMASARRRFALFLKRWADRARPGAGADRRAKAAELAMRASQAQLRHWGRFETITRAQLAPQRRVLIEATTARDGDPEVTDQVVALFLDAVHNLANPMAYAQSETASRLGFHRDIPFPMMSFSKMLAGGYRVCLAQRRAHPVRFLDVGSGGGTKVLAAMICFDRCEGLEYEESYVAPGSALLTALAPDRCGLLHGDGLTFDGYGGYDVIYYFRPIANSELMLQLEDRILEQARPGTVLLAASGMAAQDWTQKNVQKIAEQIYVTGISATEAERLRDAAEQMGTMVPGYTQRSHGDLGYWQPLYEACAQNGYFL